MLFKEFIKKILGLTNSSPCFLVIISSPRCGSNYLCELLDSHPNVICHNEIFHHENTGLHKLKISRTDLLFDKTWRDCHPHDFIKRMQDKTKKFAFNLKVIGCKLLLNDIQIQHGLETILDFNPVIIFLKRANKLAWFSSRQIAGETNIWFAKKSPSFQHKITFKAEEYLNALEEMNKREQHVLARLKARKIQFIEVLYENLIEPTTLATLLNFLKIPSKYLKSKTIKQNAVSTLARYHNAEEVKAFAAAINQLPWVTD